MIHPLFMTALRRPELLCRHAANYADLVKGELSAAGTSVAVRAAGAAIAAIAVLLALGLSAMAIMLGVLHGTFHWVLVVVPGVAWLLALSGTVMAMRKTLASKVEDVKDEIEADLKALRLVKELRNE